MLLIIKIIFWVSLFIPLYTYVVYGLLLLAINTINSALAKKNSDPETIPEPDVALVIAAYNEEQHLRQKIENSISLDYPTKKKHIYIVCDGSDDQTLTIALQYPEIKVLYGAERLGKAAAMNKAMDIVREKYVIFTDANAILNKEAIREIIKHYNNPRTGAVAGEKKIIKSTEGAGAAETEKLYWQYESFLKNQDSRLYSVVGAAGELFSLRKDLYEPLEEDIILDDFVLSLRIAMKGYPIKYAPGAFAVETASASIKEERKRKTRISAGAFQAMYRLCGLFNIFRYKTLSFQFISHRVLRWTLAPLCSFLLLPLNLVLVILQPVPLHFSLLLLQVIFYMLSFIGWLKSGNGKRIALLDAPHYFIFMNLSVLAGFALFLRGNLTVQWDKSIRAK